MRPVQIVWFRNNLRLHDNASLTEACKLVASHGAIIPLYIIEPSFWGHTSFGFEKTGPHRKLFLLEGLQDLSNQLNAIGSKLIVRYGNPADVVSALAKEVSISAIHYPAEVCPEERVVEKQVDNTCKSLSIPEKKYWEHNLIHPDDLPFTPRSMPDLFTEYRRQIEHTLLVRPPLPTPKYIPFPTNVKIKSDPIQLPNFKTGRYTGGETAAKKQLNHYLWDSDLLRRYKETRNGLLGEDYSSKLSPWLAQGSISPRLVYQELRQYENQRIKNESTYWLLFELLWRDYFYLIASKYKSKLFRPEGIQNIPIPWNQNRELFQIWQLGKTGYPLIDAIMVELLRTGFVSNRARQITASFLTKNLGIDWRMGAEWFESMLIDYDPASNYGNWCYAASVGTDARGFRYFNILKQAQEHDPEGLYVKNWLPTLRELPAGKIHTPWLLENAEQIKYGVLLGENYPKPIVDLEKSASEQQKAYDLARNNPLHLKGNYKIRRFDPQRMFAKTED